MSKAASTRARCRCSMASPIPSRCRRVARERSKAISTSSCRRSRDSGGETALMAGSIIAEGRLQLHLMHPPARFRHSRGLRLGCFGSCRQEETGLLGSRAARVDEGLCVQCMHTGPYDGEPATIDAMRTFVAEQGYAPDFSESHLHHEIYLSDPRKVRAGEAQDRDPPSHQVDVAKRAVPALRLFGGSPLRGRQWDAPCDRRRRPRRGSARSLAPPRTTSSPRSWR